MVVCEGEQDFDIFVGLLLICRRVHNDSGALDVKPRCLGSLPGCVRSTVQSMGSPLLPSIPILGAQGSIRFIAVPAFEADPPQLEELLPEGVAVA